MSRFALLYLIGACLSKTELNFDVQFEKLVLVSDCEIAS